MTVNWWNIEFGFDSGSNGTSKKPSIEQLLFAISQWIDGNKIPSVYTKGILDPRHVVKNSCKNKLDDCNGEFFCIIFCPSLIACYMHEDG